jgi:hypothetical protein
VKAWGIPILLVAIIAAPGAPIAGQRIDQIVGGVSAENVDKFAEEISDHLDKIVGLKVSVEAGDSGGMSAHVTEGMLVVYRSGGDFEIVANSGYRYEHGAYVFDGFFIVKSGGMHQGVVSYGLQEVNEAQVLLTPGVEILPVPVK